MQPILKTFMRLMFACGVLLFVTACVFEPAPYTEAPAPPGYVAAAQPCCYSYYDYPPYYSPYYYGAPAYGYAGPPVTLGFGFGGGGYHRWR